MFSIIITISLAFLSALLLTLLLTPAAAKLGRRFGALDRPNARKVHAAAIPRTGGLAIIAAFFVCRFLFFLVGESLGRFSVSWDYIGIFWVGVFFAAGVGIVDDFKRVPSSIKLFMQILAATAAFAGGIRIEVFGITHVSWQFSFITSYLLTVFWFVLLMNAINLIDGLDGLAAGVVIFGAAVMSILMVIGNQEKGALAFAILAGGTLGFLRYNFNPARIFMGDGGSYFLGYTLAYLSIQYGAKSQMGLSLLIPLIALGIPIFDVIVSPLRRFIIGQKIFQADKGHIHHRLLAMGLTTKRAVLILYTASLVLGLCALVLVNIRSEKAGVFFIILGVAAIAFIRKLGYFEYLALDKIFGWLHDIRDVAGLTRSRRAFLGIEINIRESSTFDEMWSNVCLALDMKGFHKAWLHLYDQDSGDVPGDVYTRHNVSNDPDRKTVTYWFRGHDVKRDHPQEDVSAEWRFEMKIPLLADKGDSMGVLYLVRDLRENPLSPHTVRRIESLRRSLCVAIEKIRKDNRGLEVGEKENGKMVASKKRVGAFLTRFLS